MMAALMAVVTMASPGAARADAGDLVLGARSLVEVSAGSSWGGGVDGVIDLGCTDWLAVRGALGGRVFTDRPGALQASLGWVAALDVLLWVPEISLQGGAELDGHGVLRPVGMLGLGVRRYFGIEGSGTVTVGVGVRSDAWFGWLAVGVGWGGT